MKWFKHSSDAILDAKLCKLKIRYGLQGYGLYWHCLELIARGVEKNHLTFELEHDAAMIASQWNMHVDDVQEMMVFMVDLGLFENSNGIIRCLKMAALTDEYTQKLIRNQEIVGTLSGQNPEKSVLKEKKRREQNRTEQKIKNSLCKNFTKPTLEEIKQYCSERHNEIDPNQFYDFYESKNWFIGKSKMKNFKAAIRTWERNNSHSNVNQYNNLKFI